MAVAMLAVASATRAAERLIAPHHVAASISADWTGDGIPDRAVLIETSEGGDLLIYRGQEAPAGFVQEAARRGIAWRGGLAGTQPTLTLSPSGALQVISQNETVGRHRWRETVTILWRDQRFVVGGYTLTTRDTLKAGSEVTCDINLLTGKRIVNGRVSRAKPQIHTVETWPASGHCPGR